jgi:anti-sigma-K factor RskA
VPHIDPDLLSLMALGEPVASDADNEHLRTCGACAAEHAALRRAVDAARVPSDAAPLTQPSAGVWTAIHRELALDESLAADPLEPERPQEVTNLADRRSARPRGTAAGPRRNTALWLLAGAAAVVTAAAGISWVVSQQTQTPPLAEARLEPLADFATTGTAEVIERDGERELSIELSDKEGSGYQEVWLIKPDLSGLVSLGIMDTSSATFAIPPGLDLAQYPIVDVSDEPLDGNPAHSGVSIVRGSLAL